MMKGLSVIGTAAMFLVGGGILTHGMPVVHHWIESVGAAAGGAGLSCLCCSMA
jgi:predicted DNA repair protein MutK